MVETKDITRPPADISRALAAIGTASATGALNDLGVRNSFIQGPVPWNTNGACVAGPALTLQFMPKREDLYGAGEYDDPEKQLHRHVLYHTQPGDFVVVDARGEMSAGIFGEMMITYFKGRGGVGMVIDGCVRDYAHVKTVGTPLWMRGLTPNFHTQTNLMPFAVNGPIACGGVTVMTGDITGIIVLGGAITTTRGMTSTNAKAARMMDSAALALKYPNAKLVFTGGDSSLAEEAGIDEARTEAEAASRFYRSLGISAERMILEDRSRNTFENAVFTKPLINQKPGERWLLITSAWHMPRSVGIFRKAGIDIIPYPVDFSTRGTPRDYSQLNRGFSHGLELTDSVVKEWIGLIAYRLAGYTDSLLPGP